jgi:hypothetical protein
MGGSVRLPEWAVASLQGFPPLAGIRMDRSVSIVQKRARDENAAPVLGRKCEVNIRSFSLTTVKRPHRFLNTGIDRGQCDGAGRSVYSPQVQGGRVVRWRRAMDTPYRRRADRWWFLPDSADPAKPVLV